MVRGKGVGESVASKLTIHAKTNPDTPIERSTLRLSAYKAQASWPLLEKEDDAGKLKHVLSNSAVVVRRDWILSIHQPANTVGCFCEGQGPSPPTRTRDCCRTMQCSNFSTDAWDTSEDHNALKKVLHYHGLASQPWHAHTIIQHASEHIVLGHTPCHTTIQLDKKQKSSVQDLDGFCKILYVYGRFFRLRRPIIA